MKKAINISFWVILLVGTIALLGFVDRDFHEIEINTIAVNIDQSAGHSFITKSQVLSTLNDIGIKEKQTL